MQVGRSMGMRVNFMKTMYKMKKSCDRDWGSYKSRTRNAIHRRPGFVITRSHRAGTYLTIPYSLTAPSHEPQYSFFSRS